MYQFFSDFRRCRLGEERGAGGEHEHERGVDGLALQPQADAPGGHRGEDPQTAGEMEVLVAFRGGRDRKSTRLNSSHSQISYAVFCLKKKSTVRATSSTPWTLAL